jgi:alpha-methylacyl-CoA racemase
MIGALSGVRVLDLTRLPPGGYCTQLLVDLGADVVRVEPPSAAGEPSLVLGQPGISRGKRSMTLDLRHEMGYGVLRRLAGAFDVLVENERVGAMSTRGFGYPEAERECPTLIWCSITGYGQDGPYADRSGHDLTYLAHGGLLSALSPELPWHPQAMLSVPLGAMVGTMGILAALFDRERTGHGCQVDASISEAATWVLSGNASQLTDDPRSIGVTPGRRLYQCRDGRFISVAAAEPRTWSALCTALNLPDLLDSVRPTAGEVEQITARLAAIFVEKTAAEWMEQLGPVGAAVGIVNQGRAIVEDAHNRARHSTIRMGDIDVPASPIRLRRQIDDAPRETADGMTATVGEHTDAVLAEVGFSDTEVRNLHETGVV